MCVIFTFVEELINQLQSKNPYLKLGEVEGILFLIKNTPNLTNNDLIRFTGIPKETLRTFKSSVSHMLKDSEDDSIAFKDEVKGDFSPYSWSLLNYSDEKAENKLLEIRKKYNLEPKREYDQFFADVKTSISKARVLIDKGVVVDKDIIIVGDDDLVSVTLGLMKAPYRSVTVLDIDSDVLATIQSICKDLGIVGIHTRVYDVREGLNDDLKGRFDVVMTDPPYTRSGIELFLKRAVELLASGENKYVFMCYGNSFKSPEKTLKIQEVIDSYNLLVEDRIDKFNRYHGAESIGSASALYVLKATPFTYVPESSLEQAIYTYETDKIEKFPFVDHYTFKLQNVPQRLLSSKKTIQKVFGDFCRIHKLKVVSANVTKFKGQGLTLSFVLSQSNLTVHTWPEYGALHVVLVTCTPIYNKETMNKTLSRLLATDLVEMKRVE